MVDHRAGMYLQPAQSVQTAETDARHHMPSRRPTSDRCGYLAPGGANKDLSLDTTCARAVLPLLSGEKQAADRGRPATHCRFLQGTPIAIQASPLKAIKEHRHLVTDTTSPKICFNGYKGTCAVSKKYQIHEARQIGEIRCFYVCQPVRERT